MRQGIWQKDFESYKSRENAEKIEKRLRASVPYNGQAVIIYAQNPTDGTVEPVLFSTGGALGKLFYTHQIDTAKYAAGRRMEKCLEESAIGNIKAIDPGKTAVDGGKLPEVITDTQMKASDEVAAANKALGPEKAQIVHDILARRLNLSEAAKMRGLTTEWEIRKFGETFRDCLEILARHWGYA